MDGAFSETVDKVGFVNSNNGVPSWQASTIQLARAWKLIMRIGFKFLFYKLFVRKHGRLNSTKWLSFLNYIFLVAAKVSKEFKHVHSYETQAKHTMKL